MLDNYTTFFIKKLKAFLDPKYNDKHFNNSNTLELITTLF